MKTSLSFLVLPALALTLLLPATRSRSQMLPAPTDPLAQMQALATANEDLLKRQDATLKDLTDMTDTANEVRIFSRRN